MKQFVYRQIIINLFVYRMAMKAIHKIFCVSLNSDKRFCDLFTLVDCPQVSDLNCRGQNEVTV